MDSDLFLKKTIMFLETVFLFKVKEALFLIKQTVSTVLKQETKSSSADVSNEMILLLELMVSAGLLFAFSKQRLADFSKDLIL